VESAIEVVHGFVQGVMSVVNTIYEAVDFVMSIADTVTAFVGQIKSFGDKVSAFIKKLFPDRNYKGSDGGQIANREAVKLLNLCLSSPPYVIPPGLGTERTQVAINKLATSNILRELAGVAGLKAAAWAKPASRTEAKELRELVLEAVDFMLDYASSDAFFRQILKTRGYVLNAIAEAAKAAPDVVEYNEIMIIPALTVVWRRVLRDSMSNNLDVSVDELVKRNKIRHPGFIAPGPLEIRLV
jgi:hypothetical protein